MTAVRVARDGPVLRVTLARPERRNAFDPTLIDGLAGAFADVGDARAVVLDGEGPSFSAGADIEWMRASVELTEEENVEDALRFERMLEAVDACEAPVVARVHGHVLGGAAGLIACTDVAVAAEDTVFGFSGGEARHRAGHDLHVRDRPHRPGRGPSLLPDRRALRRA